MSKANLKIIMADQKDRPITLLTVAKFVLESGLLEEYEMTLAKEASRRIYEGRELNADVDLLDILLDNVLYSIRTKQKAANLIKKFKVEVLGESNE